MVVEAGVVLGGPAQQPDIDVGVAVERGVDPVVVVEREVVRPQLGSARRGTKPGSELVLVEVAARQVVSRLRSARRAGTPMTVMLMPLASMSLLRASLFVYGDRGRSPWARLSTEGPGAGCPRGWPASRHRRGGDSSGSAYGGHCPARGRRSRARGPGRRAPAAPYDEVSTNTSGSTARTRRRGRHAARGGRAPARRRQRRPAAARERGAHRRHARPTRRPAAARRTRRPVPTTTGSRTPSARLRARVHEHRLAGELGGRKDRPPTAPSRSDLVSWSRGAARRRSGPASSRPARERSGSSVGTDAQAAK